MATSLAFLKQTMSKASFEAYCIGLNGTRGIKYTIGEGGKINYDRNNPRCIEPDTIGTVEEVYNTFHERFHEYKVGTLKDKDIDPRDIAMLTALKNLEEKNKKLGKNLVVEHEALCEELEKVQKDPRFKEAIKNKSRDELIEMAWWNHLDTIDGYTKPLPPDKQKLVDEEKARKAAEEAKKAEEAEKPKKPEKQKKPEKPKKLQKLQRLLRKKG